MVRGGYRGSRGGGWGGGDRGYGRNSRSYSSYDRSHEKPRYSERYEREDYNKSYNRMDSYSTRHSPHSPERKRSRNEGPSRHEYGGRYESYPSERRSYDDRERERPSSSPYQPRREEFRKPLPPSIRGLGRGRLTSRGTRGIRRDRGGPRRMADRSYAIKKRGLLRPREFSRRGTRAMRIRSIQKRRRMEMLEDEDDMEMNNEEETEEEQHEEPSINEEAKIVPKEEEESEAKEEEAMEISKKADMTERPKKVYVKLSCPQCHVRCQTFRGYELHLQGSSHAVAMRRVAYKQSAILAQMRKSQRSAQNDLEKNTEGITEHTVFCPTCKLNYKQERAVHQATSAHKNMRKFLLPNCKVCKIQFKSPMAYEHHLCSVDHLKKKQKTEKQSDEDNLDEFTTIDSVGEPEAEEATTEEKPKKKEVSVGIEKIKKIEAYYCYLCRMFLPIGTENEYPDILAGHCKKGFHMARYVRFKESENLKKKAEELQKKEDEEKVKVEVKQETESEEKQVEEKEVATVAPPKEDKLWDAVDKDLGELLEDTDDTNAEAVLEDDDEEDGVNGERYDRFKSAENKKTSDSKKSDDKKEDTKEK